LFAKEKMKERYKKEYEHALYNSILKVKKPHLFKSKSISDPHIEKLIPKVEQKHYGITDYELLGPALKKFYDSCPENLIKLVERKQKHLDKLLKAKKKSRSKKYNKKIKKISYYAGCLESAEPYIIVGG
jgi:hypothetical protein